MARGGIAYVSKGSAMFSSQSDSVLIGAAKDVGVTAKEGNIAMKIGKGDFKSETEDGEVHVKSTGKMVHESSEESIKMTAQKDFGIESKENGVQVKAQQDIGIKSTSGDIQASAVGGNVEMTAQSKMDLRATGDASLHGATTHVTADSTAHVKAGNTVNVDGPTGLNLNGLLGMVMPALGLQLDFDFGQFAFDDPKSRGVHAPDSPASNQSAKNWA